MSCPESTQAWRRSKTKYYVESIFKPPQNITCPNVTNSCDGNVYQGGPFGAYVILEFEPVFQKISYLLNCKMCSGCVTFASAQMRGLGFKLVVGCQNCGELDRIDSSKIIGPTSNDYEINARNELACQYLTGMSDMRSNVAAQDSLNSQEQPLSSSSLKGTHDNEMERFSHSVSQQHQNSQPNYFPGNTWVNHSLFGGLQDSNSLMQNQANWSMDCANEPVASETKGKYADDDNDFDSEAEDSDEDSDGSQQHSSTFENSLSFSQGDNSVSPGCGTKKKQRRRAVKKKREEGQRMTADTPLPNFSSYVLEELTKPTPRMSVVLPPCKAHIVAVTGDEYPTKKEYEVFSLKMVLAYPSLKDPDTDHGFERFKKSLSASFRARRSYERNIKPNRLGKKSLGLHCLQLPNNSCGLDPNATNMTEVDQNSQLFYHQPSTSSLSMERSEDEDLSYPRDNNRSCGENEWQDGSDSEGSEHSETNSQHNATACSDNEGRPKRKRRRAVKKIRGEGQCLTSDTPLPVFSLDVLEELAKPTPRMSVVLPSCKAHIVAVTGDEYPTKKEYEIFSLKMVLAFPNLKDPDTDHGFERFKKSLSSSFRARRSYELNKKPCRMQRRALAHLEVRPPSDPRIHLSQLQAMQDEEIKAVDEELSRTNCDMDPDRARFLIEKSFNFRRKLVSSSNFDDIAFLQTYKHLHSYDMVLYEYSLIVGISIQELRTNFEEGLMVLTNMFWDAAQLSHLSKELKKAHVLVQLQEHFLNQKHMRQDVKPLIVIKDEVAAFNDGDVSFRSTQVPCALVLTNEGSISKLMITYKDSIVLERCNPSAFDMCSILLAFFFIMNIKYPPVYLDNLKALERLLNKKLSLSSLQTTISSPYSNYVKLYEAKLKEVQMYFKPEPQF